MPERLAYTAGEAAEALAISASVLDELEADGLIHRIDYGVTASGQPRRIRRYSLDELRRFAAVTSTYTPAEEEARHAETTIRRPQAVPTQGRPLAARRSGRSRKSRSSRAALPLRIVE